VLNAGVPIVRPRVGMRPSTRARCCRTFPTTCGIALVNALYVEAGVRGVEIGTVMFGLHADGTETAAALDLVRLAIPRRVYTQSHIDYVAEAVIHVARMRDQLRGYRITAAPRALRHFTAAFAPRG
jgi:tryptophanase